MLSVGYKRWDLFHKIKAPPLAALYGLDAVAVGTAHAAFGDFSGDGGPWHTSSKQGGYISHFLIAHMISIIACMNASHIRLFIPLIMLLAHLRLANLTLEV
jgi:hypothetical protein